MASGKTSLTRALAECLKWKRVAFGDYVRGEFRRQRGHPGARPELQDFGQDLAESDPESLCRAVLRLGDFAPGGNILIDGVRHASVYRVLMDIVRPSRTYLIYLHADSDLRRLRAAQRHEVLSASTASHPVEAELGETVLKMADMVVDADGAFGEVLRRCVDALTNVGVDSGLTASCREYADRM